MATGKFVGYYRVSMPRQGQSGLGLDAQKAAVRAYLDGGKWTLVKEFTEVESGKRHENRPQLDKALNLAHVTGSRLIVAKLDRLSRDVHFLSGLMKSRVRFVCVDQPGINELTLHVLAAVAENEAKRISERTKSALAEAKKRGTKLGNPNGARALRLAGKGNTAALAGKQRAADEYAAHMAGILTDIQESGIMTLEGVARELVARGIETRRGGAAWTATAVRRIRSRLQPASPARPAEAEAA